LKVGKWRDKGEGRLPQAHTGQNKLQLHFIYVLVKSFH